MKKHWSKIAFFTIDAIILAYLVFVMVSFSHPLSDSKQQCSEVRISISDNVTNGFLSSAKVKDILTGRQLYPLGKNLNDVDTRQIEEFLTDNPLINSAQCYRTYDGKICIDLVQRKPVLRVKSINGDDYYLDDKGEEIHKVQYTTDLAVASGYISRKYARKFLTGVGNAIIDDAFWADAVEQFNVLPDGTLELVPRVGDHVVYLGKPVKIKEKLDRLYKFYIYGLNKIGWNKYSYIDMEFDNQIICKKRESEN